MTPVPPRENLFARHATAIAIGVITAAFLFAALMFVSQDATLSRARNWVDHTYTVRRHISLLRDLYENAETGQPGYLLTGNPDFLQTYHDALRDARNAPLDDARTPIRRSIRQELALLRHLTADNPSQQANLDELDLRSQALLDYLASTIRARTLRNGQQAGAAEVAEATLAHGKYLMERVREQLSIMTTEEEHLLRQRQEVDATSLGHNKWLMGIITLISYVAIVLAVWLYQRSRARSLAQQRLYTRELEQREEELKMQQEELKASNEEIEASNEELEEKTGALEEQNERIRAQARDLEEAKRLIEEKAREVEQSSKYKSEFLANMSHELRTPLNSLLILSRGLAANETGNLTAEQVEEARVIHNGGLELLNLINDILDLSKVEAGKIHIIAEDTPIDAIVSHLSQSFERVARDKGVAFHIACDPALPARLHTDAQRVEQIMKNLLSNAFKFTQQGSVTLALERAAKGVALQRADLDPARTIGLSVTDTGIGIGESKLKDIFEAFQQEDGSTDRHYGGTGLGLTIARKFAQVLGGEIHVRSIKGQGSTFTLFLPLGEAGTSMATADRHSKPAQPETVLPEGTERGPATRFLDDDRQSLKPGDRVLLIIEDDPEFAMTLMKTARKRGYKVLAAGDGKSGLILAADYPVRAILLDLRLPDIDGLNVLDQLKHALNTRHIPVHIISGADDAEPFTPMRKGAVGFLAKPVAEEEIDTAFTRIEAMLRAEIKHVLLIEDDRVTQTAIRRLLGQKNIEITVAETGSSAFEQMKLQAFDCVILDLSLPDMTGFEWLKLAEGVIGEDGRPPVIVHTARDLTEEENRNLARYTGSIVIKGASSSERLLDEVTLFLHSIEASLSRDQQALIRMHHDPDQSLKNRTVLLVDDDMRNTFALSRALKKHSLNLVIADNGQMALEKLKENDQIELVIMDIMMPVMDGYQTMREIRGNREWAQLPIIALTARAMPEEVDRCMEAGANDYMMKPVDIDRLLTLLRVWLFRQEKAA
ncbi:MULTISPECIES: response regulator [unclassified Novosphingobium]|uniref:response regulator n=1 Tax=unclassified Novosphingobium TaxID=2644732 RepID=UPI0012D26DF6|nr:MULTISPECIES: response regulator [unclassified Novosphingobium]MPS69646.1 response regulator [Novosphingobium sp.]WRT94907.1 response regulator [Novosphingobium sp. RL4]